MSDSRGKGKNKEEKNEREQKVSSSSASSSQKSPAIDDLQKIPDSELPHILSPFLNLSEQTKLSITSKRSAALFKTQASLKQLLHLVVKHEIKNEKKIQEAIEQGVNPIFNEVSAILRQDPTLALKRDYITDNGNKIYCSPLEYAYKSGNWIMCNLIFEWIKRIPPQAGQESGEIRAAKQIRELDEKAYNYDVELWLAKGDTLPRLKKNTPALIKQRDEEGNEKIFEWGDINGTWGITELDNEDKRLLEYLSFINFMAALERGIHENHFNL